MNPLTIPAYHVETDPGVADVTEATLADRAIVEAAREAIRSGSHQHREHVVRQWRDADSEMT